MKKFYYLLLLIVVALGSPFASAEVVQDYVEHFDNLNVSEKSFAPKYWGHHVCGNSYRTMPYANPSEGGQSGAYLEAGEQQDYYGTPYPDYMVTPKVAGEVRLYAKLTEEGGSVKFYKVTGQDSEVSYTFEETEYDIPGKPALSTGAWTEIVIPDVPADTQLGILMENAAIDEFSAATADLIAKRSLKISYFHLPEDVTEMDSYADADGCVSAVFDVEITNTGDVDFAVGEEDYNLTFHLGTYSSAREAVCATVPIDKALAAGSTTVLHIETKLDVSTASTGNYATDYVWVKDAVSKTSAPLQKKSGSSWFAFYGTFYPYVPIAKFYRSDVNAEYKSTIQSGMLKDGSSKMISFLLKNTAGKAPLTVTAVSLPEGYSLVSETAFTVEAGGQKEMQIQFNATEPGDYSGNIVFTTTELGEVACAIAGYVFDSSKWSVDFEGSKDFPEGFLAGANWSIGEAPETIAGTGNLNCAEQNDYSSSALITPRLTFAEGDKLVFFLASRSGSGLMNISYSTDRNNWVQLVEISRNAEEEKNKISLDQVDPSSYNSAYLYRQYVLEGIPAGDYFLSFNGYGVRLDNLNGAVRANTDKDLYITSSVFPSEGTVNHAVNVNVSMRNMGNALAAGDYTATLYFNGEAVANSETFALAKDDAETFSFVYTPHAAGEYTAYVEFKSGDYAVCTAEAAIKIAEETAEMTVKTGNEDTTTNYLIVPSSYKSFQSETVYPKAMLNGLTAGDKISSLTYYGYCYTYDDTHSDLPVKVYVENTTDELPDGTNFHPVDGMTLAYDGIVEIDWSNTSSSSPYGKVYKVTFSEPFEYTGNNIRISYVLDAVDGWGYSDYIYVTADGSYQNSTIYQGSWSVSTIAAGTPVVRFGILQTPGMVSGSVTDKDSAEPVADAEVVLASGDVLYKGVTDENGQYSIEVIQATKDYGVAVTAEGYVAYASEAPVSFVESMAVTHNVELEKVKVAISGTVVAGNSPVAGADVKLVAGEIELTAETGEDGKFSVVTTGLNRDYVLTVNAAGYDELQQTVSIADEDVELGNLSLVAGLDAVDFSGLKVVAGAGSIELAASGKVAVTIVDLAGRTLMHDAGFVGTTRIEGLSAGIYFVNNRKVVVR